jgi:hypothetical protein
MNPAVSPPRGTRRPFTLVACTQCGDEVAMDALRATVRSCEHAMLVTTGCLLGGDTCPAAGTDGMMAMLQPCTVDRTPVGPRRWFGPIAPADAPAVCAALASGQWNAPAC